MKYKTSEFLKFDRGPKTETVSSRIQPELASKLDILSGGQISTYIREVLIMHVRKEMENSMSPLNNQ